MQLRTNSMANQAADVPESGNGTAAVEQKERPPDETAAEHAGQGDGVTAPDPAIGVTRRPSIAELQAAVGPQSDGITLGQAEERYECLEKLAPGVYFRAHPDRKLWQDTVVLIDTDGMDRAAYLVAPGIQPALCLWIKRVLLVPCQDQDHNFFIFRIGLSDLTLGQRPNPSEKTRLAAMESAIKTWTTIAWSGKRHVSRSADGDLGQPDWPKDLTVELINWRTFQDHYIGDRQHPIAKYYLGLARR